MPSTYTAARLIGSWIMGQAAYLANFWLVSNRMEHCLVKLLFKWDLSHPMNIIALFL